MEPVRTPVRPIAQPAPFRRVTALPLVSDNVMPFTCSDICKLILAIILPPLGVFMEKGCDIQLAINILLTILGYIPGIIHAIWVIFYY
uniref:Plasma membrane proteolipid 3 n=1 Tax=Steinernema glaseri TaxID=37863 RepID=A0A1I7ZTM8_9BILA